MHVEVGLVEVAGGQLRVQLTTDHPLAHHERVSLERIVEACEEYGRLHPSALHDDTDDAIAALGGEENICAG
jgi:hypothetical protein